jgi:tRNA nucleotidyltransferase (CCA-adding enzyme)
MEKIEPTLAEAKVFDLLVEVAAPLNVVVRVAGGWVRDRLLGRVNQDIDVAVEGMDGEEFAQHVLKCLHTHDYQDAPRNVAVIRANPAQSKHLNTATLTLHGMSIDFCGLRDEVYDDNHGRIPQLLVGEQVTPAKDAMRRDLTINALYFNLSTRQVEDHVGGIADLKAQLLRTPRDPLVTFRDDPLRILRAARFAGRFGYSIHEDMSRAACDLSIQTALSHKVTRERMGIECEQMWQASSFDAVFCSFTWLLERWQLGTILFRLPSTIVSIDLVHATRYSLAMLSELKQQGDDNTGIHAQGDLSRAACLAPYHGYYVSRVNNSAVPTPLVHYIVRESLRLSLRDAKETTTLLELAHSLIAQAPFTQPDKALLLVIGQWLRRMGHIRRFHLVCCLARTLVMVDSEQQVSSVPMCSLDHIHAHITWLTDKSGYLQPDAYVWNMRPMMNGHALAQHLQLQAGPSIGAALERMIDWQLLHYSLAVQQPDTARAQFLASEERHSTL